MRGELLRLAGDQVAAEESFRLAIARAVAQQAKSFELRAATGLAKLLLTAGRRDDARGGARARVRLVHRGPHDRGPRRGASSPSRDRIVTETGTPPLPFERVLEDEYAFLHVGPDEPPPGELAAGLQLPISCAATRGPGTPRCACRAAGCAAPASASACSRGSPGPACSDKFDYLSTVSGGGYIGGWLTAWRLHAQNRAQPIRAK